MNTINPTANSRLEQLERAVLDAVYASHKMNHPEVKKVLKEITRANNRGNKEEGSRLVQQLQDLVGGDVQDLAEWMIQMLTVTSNLDKSVQEYALARDLLGDLGQQ